MDASTPPPTSGKPVSNFRGPVLERLPGPGWEGWPLPFLSLPLLPPPSHLLPSRAGVPEAGRGGARRLGPRWSRRLRLPRGPWLGPSVRPSVCPAMAAPAPSLWTLLLLLLLLPPPPGGEPGRRGRCVLPGDRVQSDTSPSCFWSEPDCTSLGVLRLDALITNWRLQTPPLTSSCHLFPPELILPTFVVSFTV